MGHLLAMECWHPSFKLTKDVITKVNIWLRPPNLPIDVWDKDMIRKVATKASKPYCLDDWMACSSCLGLLGSVQLDITQSVCLGTGLRINDQMLWQEFIYEDLPDICYVGGHIGITMETCGCKYDDLDSISKLLYGP